MVTRGTSQHVLDPGLAAVPSVRAVRGGDQEGGQAKQRHGLKFYEPNGDLGALVGDRRPAL